VSKGGIMCHELQRVTEYDKIGLYYRVSQKGYKAG